MSKKPAKPNFDPAKARDEEVHEEAEGLVERMKRQGEKSQNVPPDPPGVTRHPPPPKVK